MKLTGLSFVAGLGGLVACGPAAEAPREPSAPPVVRASDALAAGVVRGIVELLGEAPPRRPVLAGASDGCGTLASQALSETLVVEGGRIANVLVRVKSGLPPGSAWPVPAAPVVLDQRGCIYQPHVVVVRAGQTLLVRNSDPLLHNVNARPARGGNEAFNRNHAPGTAELELQFPQPETAIPFRCDVHPWMAAYVHVLEHPFFALSGPDGTFELSGLPPGEYELEAVHEWLGRQTFRVELGTQRGVEVELRFRVPAAR